MSATILSCASPDVYAVIAYYLNNQAKIQDYIQLQEAETERIWGKYRS